MDAKKVLYADGVGIYYPDKVNSINVDNIKKLINNKESDVILTSIGELSKRKNHILTIKALKNIPDRNIKYLIIGEGKMHYFLEKKIKQYGLEDRVFLISIQDYVTNSFATKGSFGYERISSWTRRNWKSCLFIGQLFVFEGIRCACGRRNALCNR